MAYIDRPLDNSTGTDMTLREGCDLINDNFEVIAADKLKLDGIEAGAQVNAITSVAGQTTGDVVLTKSDVGLGDVDNVQQAPITRTITAGTGLTGGGDLTADRTLSVSYGTTAGTAAQGNDSRLSDAREWTATVVSQTEAETGTATTARKWTAQRVRQAIAAWWNTVGTTFGKTLLGSTDAAAARSSLGLGTAATKNVGTGSGNVMEVGTGGLGVRYPATVVDANTLPELYPYSGIAPLLTNTGSTNVPHTYVYIQQFIYSGGTPNVNVTQIAYSYNNNKVWVRYRYSGVWTGWNELLTAGTLLTDTGQSTVYPMTQKAVTDALATKADSSHSHSAATTSAAGFVELATNTEVQTGTDAARAITPAGLSARTATETRTGLVEKATNAEALAGTADKFPDAAVLKYVIQNSPIGTAETANRLATARTITVAGAVDGSATFDGSTNATITVSKKVGEFYIQFPGASAPSTLFGGTWSARFESEGIFFRTPGGNALAFNAGIQGGNLQSHSHTVRGERFTPAGSNYVIYALDFENGSTTEKSFTTSETGGTETRPINRTIRVWELIAI